MPGRLFSRSLMMAHIRALNTNPDWDASFNLPKEALEELEWWAEELRKWNLFFENIDDIANYTELQDASRTGYRYGHLRTQDGHILGSMKCRQECEDFKRIAYTVAAIMEVDINENDPDMAEVFEEKEKLVYQVHKKTVVWLVHTFGMVVLPKFGTKDMSICGPGLSLSSEMVRKMLAWAHAWSLRRLLSKAEEVGVLVVIPVSEAYICKTCSEWGHVYRRLGVTSTFKCAWCSAIMDLGVNVAKGILLRTLACGALDAPKTL
ncbi:uncharacterized protein VTP21DRAFT_2583 [Calcarisporiella thermophila]|uniref:uncharacterized protein n=1 Tax=Calcarisporiella thermophila TaxID=911321 RepID=UPI003742A4A4